MRGFRHREGWSCLPRISQKQSQGFYTSLLAFNPVSLNTVPQWLDKSRIHHTFTKISKVCVCVLSLFSHVQFSATLWTAACQCPPSMGSSRQEYWSGLPSPPPGDLPDPRIELTSLMSPALAGKFFTTSATWEAPSKACTHIFYEELPNNNASFESYWCITSS